MHIQTCISLRIQKNMGVTVFVDGAPGWCKEELKLIVEADKDGFFESSDFGKLIRVIGERILPAECSSANKILVTGKYDKNLLWQGSADKASGWKVVSQNLENDEFSQILTNRAESLCAGRSVNCSRVLEATAKSWLNEALEQSLENQSSRRRFELLFSNPGALAGDTVRLELFQEALRDEEFTGELSEKLNSEFLAREDIGLPKMDAKAKIHIASDIAVDIITSMAIESLARYYEQSEEKEKAYWIRTGAKPSIEIGTLVYELDAGTTTVSGAAAGAAVIWGKNLYSFTLLGARLNEDDATGQDVQSRLDMLAKQNVSIIDSLKSGETRGVLYRGYETRKLTTKEIDVLQDMLLANNENQNALLKQKAMYEEFAWVVEGARKFAKLVASIEAGGTYSGLEHANSTPSLPKEVAQLSTKVSVLQERAISLVESIYFDDVRVLGLASVASEIAKTGDQEKADYLYSKSIQTAKTLDAYNRVRVLAEIATQIAKTGDLDKANHILLEAIQAADSIKGKYAQSKALMTIIDKFKETGNYDKAIQIAKSIEDEDIKNRALQEVVNRKIGSEVALGNYDKATQIVEAMGDKRQQFFALADIVSAIAKTGNYDKADQAADIINDDKLRSAVKSVIPAGIAEAGNYDKAIQLAEGIKDDRRKAGSLTDVAVFVAKSGNQKKAAYLLSEAIQLAKGIKDDGQKVRALTDVAVTAAKTGNQEKADYLFSEAIETAKTIEDKRAKAHELRSLSEYLARAGSYDKAIQIAKSIESVSESEVALWQIACDLARAGKYGKAIQVAEAQAADSIEGSFKSYSLREIAKELAKGEKYDKAIQIAMTIENQDFKSGALHAVAEDLAGAGNYDKAIQTAMVIEKQNVKGHALQVVAEDLAGAGNYYKAIQTAMVIEQARGMANAVKVIAIELSKPHDYTNEQKMVIASKVMEMIGPMEKSYQAKIAAEKKNERKQDQAAREHAVIAEKQRIQALRTAAEEKWKSKWDADLKSGDAWENLTDLMRYNKAVTIATLSKGHLVKLEYKNKDVEFVKGKSVLQDYQKGTDIYEGIPKGRFSWSKWFDQINSVGSNQSFTVYCSTEPDMMVGLNEGQHYVFQAKLQAVRDSDYLSAIVLDCEKAD